jgi:carbonic anhydrase
MRLSLLAALVIGSAALAAAQNPNWTYQGKNGPLRWGKLDPSYQACSKGNEQSPIDIRGARVNKTLQPIEFHYKAGPVTVENSGHMIVVHLNPGSFIVAGGVRYELLELDLKHPAEEPVRGKLADMSAQLVHKSADGKMAIVSVRLLEDQNFPNTFFAALFDHLPRTAGKSEKIADMVNPGALLPTNQTYWTYMGSLPQPPCTEGVRWFVLEHEMTLSRDQLRTFAAIYKVNTREVQDPHGRKIEATE